MIIVGRFINGIMLNDLEWLLDSDGELMPFETIDEAKAYLREKGFSDEEMYYMKFVTVRDGFMQFNTKQHAQRMACRLMMRKWEREDSFRAMAGIDALSSLLDENIVYLSPDEMKWNPAVKVMNQMGLRHDYYHDVSIGDRRYPNATGYVI